MSLKQLFPLAVLAIVGCHSGANDTVRFGTASRQSDVLTKDEMVAAHADVNTAYDAVARLRPNWLAVHGVTSAQTGGGSTETAVVYVDGQRYGPITSLRNIQAFNVMTMRYYDITQAGARFGIQGGAGGVIEITTR